MLERFIENEESVNHCLEIIKDAEFSLKDADWFTLRELLGALQPSRDATTQLQGKELTMSDFYKIWTICAHQTKQLSMYDSYVE